VTPTTHHDDLAQRIADARARTDDARTLLVDRKSVV
jgi:hypothetical protein